LFGRKVAEAQIYVDRSITRIWKNTLGVFSIGANFIFALSPCTIKHFWRIRRLLYVMCISRILHICLTTPSLIKFSWNILRIRIIFAHKKLRIHPNEVTLSTVPGRFIHIYILMKKLNEVRLWRMR
jgi:hypothetical protein